jgi:hypothetical protein
MKRQIVKVAAGIALLAMVSCSGGANKSNLDSKWDLHTLEKLEEVKKIDDEVVSHLGEQISQVDEISVSIHAKLSSNDQEMSEYYHYRF